MANFVLVHGAWHWGGCFQKLAAELLAAGHNVAMPDLATHGFDATPAGTVADMAQYTAPARRMVESSSEPVYLLGHSMGGATCTYLGEQLPGKIAALIYLTAFLTPNGKSPNDYIFSAPYAGDPAAAELLQLLAPDDGNIRLDMTQPALAKAAFYADCSDHDIRISAANIQPLQTGVPFGTPAAVSADKFGRLRRIYIECTADKAIPIAMQRQMQADTPGTSVISMATSHSPFFSAPEALAKHLCSLV